MDDPMRPRPFRVAGRRRETADTVTLTLAPAGGPAPAFAPGQFNMVYAFGVGEVPISVSGAADRGVTHTIRAVGAVTRALCAARVGDVLGVRGPFGTAWPLDAAVGSDLVFVAGGIGLAPLMPAFRAAVARRAEFGRITLIYGARTPADLVFRDELHRLRGAFGLEVEVTVDRGDDAWFGPVGFVTRLVARAELEPGETVAMLCGPEVMMRFCVHELTDRGVDGDGVYVSLERNMECAIGHCGHCQLGPYFVCKDGPVFAHPRVASLLEVAQL